MSFLQCPFLSWASVTAMAEDPTLGTLQCTPLPNPQNLLGVGVNV